MTSESIAALQAVVDAATIILISGFRDPSGDAVQNAELARNRAIGARDALVAAGIPAERTKLRKPEIAEGTGDAKEARRVEFHVQ